LEGNYAPLDPPEVVSNQTPWLPSKRLANFFKQIYGQTGSSGCDNAKRQYTQHYFHPLTLDFVGDSHEKRRITIKCGNYSDIFAT